jgi:hypothetical protein
MTQGNDRSSEIVVAGDVAIDMLQWTPRQKKEKEVIQNWLLDPGFKMISRPGATLLLARMVESAIGTQVLSPRIDDLSAVSPEEVLHSLARLGEFPRSNLPKDRGSTVYRVERFDGFSGPSTGRLNPIPLADDDKKARIIVLDDAGNGFRDCEECWPRAIKEGRHAPTIVLKMNRPMGEGELWKTLIDRHSERLVTIVNASSLRASGLNISKKLSWEKTAQDFAWQLEHNALLQNLTRSRHLIVLFGIEGAIHCTLEEQQLNTILYYDPLAMEDDYKDDRLGMMQGRTCAFAAAIAARLYRDGMASIGDGVKDGLKSSRRLFLHGFGRPPSEPTYPVEKIFQAQDSDPMITDVLIPHNEEMENNGKRPWTILAQVAGEELEKVAYRIAIEGSVPPIIRAPVARFGALMTVDRVEIESYRSITNLLDEYLSKDEVTVPLSIAVFGQPGSGKTYGVTQISKSLQPEKIEKLEFDVAQFHSPDDLTNAFHKVQSTALRGKIPLVFFDEFDCFHGQKMGWLKYFLAPMEDGVFKDGETFHPIGKSIFVFAGGTSHKFEEFYCDYAGKKTISYEEMNIMKQASSYFTDAKGPDFVSRLRGYVNITGINPTSEGDRLYLIRRAMILRSIMMVKCPQIFDELGNAHIDPGVLRALIKVNDYKHGVRSMEAVLEMSLLSERCEFEPAALPPRDQLNLHVDADHFLRLVLEDV